MRGDKSFISIGALNFTKIGCYVLRNRFEYKIEIK